MWSTQRDHQENEGKSGLETKRVRDLGALRCLHSKKEGCGRDMSRNTLLKQCGERKMNWGLSWERSCWGKKASWGRWGSGSAEAGRNKESWKRGIDEQWARKESSGDDCCYQRQSEWSCKFQRWGGWGSWFSRTCTNNIWRASGVSCHCRWNITNAARDISTRK